MRNKCSILMVFLFIMFLCSDLWAQQVTSEEDDKLIYCNVLSDEETVLEMQNLDIPFEALSRGFTTEGSEIPEGSINLFSLSDFEIIPDPEELPWRMNCVLLFKQSGVYYMGSGFLIDPKHVLTAGYNVHEGQGGDWSTDIIVAPAYENNSMPYGVALGVGKSCFNGWINNSDLRYNIGMVELNRPMGAITGCFDYDSGYSLEDHFFNAGYPAEAPFDGGYMYVRHGTLDFSSDYFFGFYQKFYAGMGGSAVFVPFDSDNFVVYGVVSHGDNSTTNCVCITSSKKQEIDNLIINHTPTGIDFIPLNVNTSSTIRAGNRLPYLSFLVHNYSSASWSGVLNISVYLSRNSSISPSDTLIDSNHLTSSFGPKETQLWYYTPIAPLIGRGTTPGEYYIGLALEITDYNTENNYSSGHDAAPITVY